MPLVVNCFEEFYKYSAHSFNTDGTVVWVVPGYVASSPDCLYSGSVWVPVVAVEGVGIPHRKDAPQIRADGL